MNPEYEFLTDQWKQRIAQPQHRITNRDRRSEPELRKKFIYRLGEVMISGGTWLKKTSNAQINDRRAAI